MFFSEGVIFNVKLIQTLWIKQPLLVLPGILGTHVAYGIMLIYCFDLVLRHGFQSFKGIYLTGCIYGLINEGIFADLIFKPGFLPSSIGLSVDRLLFPALSWHPLLDFVLVWWMVNRLLSGRLGLERKIPSLKGIFFMGFFCLYWHLWSHSLILKNLLPDGILPEIRVLWILYPICTLAVLLALMNGKSFVLKPILTHRVRLGMTLLLGLLFILRAVMIASPIPLLSFLLILFLVWISSTQYQEGVPLKIESSPLAISRSNLALSSFFILVFMTFLSLNCSSGKWLFVWEKLGAILILMWLIISAVLFLFVLLMSLKKWLQSRLLSP
jgi:hypothetical protein